jgi:hypothetical protein
MPAIFSQCRILNNRSSMVSRSAVCSGLFGMQSTAMAQTPGNNLYDEMI